MQYHETYLGILIIINDSGHTHADTQYQEYNLYNLLASLKVMSIYTETKDQNQTQLVVVEVSETIYVDPSNQKATHIVKCESTNCLRNVCSTVSKSIRQDQLLEKYITNYQSCIVVWKQECNNMIYITVVKCVYTHTHTHIYIYVIYIT